MQQSLHIHGPYQTGFLSESGQRETQKQNTPVAHLRSHTVFIKLFRPQTPTPYLFSHTAAEQAETRWQAAHCFRYPVLNIYFYPHACALDRVSFMRFTALISGYCNTNAVHACFLSRHRHERVPAVLPDSEPPAQQQWALQKTHGAQAHEKQTHTFFLALCKHVCIHLSLSRAHK